MSPNDRLTLNPPGCLSVEMLNRLGQVTDHRFDSERLQRVIDDVDGRARHVRGAHP